MPSLPSLSSLRFAFRNGLQGGGRRRLPSAAPRSGPREEPRESSLDLREERAATRDPDSDAETAAHVSAAATGVLRWGAFSCALVPLALLTCGVPWITALGAGVGFGVVTAVSGVLLRRSEIAYAPRQGYGTGRAGAGGPGPHRGRHSRTGTGLHRGERHWWHPGER
ncbi:hypothetical protein [Streptomyces nanshensis]|uniref:hypothetical protein n=1 Tax=Streptomyces nanshensis TaxID=518642 RepID=UPI001FD149DA|nr:hypothetical protein [Streptomyces nanshensis]